MIKIGNDYKLKINGTDLINQTDCIITYIKDNVIIETIFIESKDDEQIYTLINKVRNEELFHVEISSNSETVLLGDFMKSKIERKFELNNLVTYKLVLSII